MHSYQNDCPLKSFCPFTMSCVSSLKDSRRSDCAWIWVTGLKHVTDDGIACILGLPNGLKKEKKDGSSAVNFFLVLLWCARSNVVNLFPQLARVSPLCLP